MTGKRKLGRDGQLGADLIAVGHMWDLEAEVLPDLLRYTSCLLWDVYSIVTTRPTGMHDA